MMASRSKARLAAWLIAWIMLWQMLTASLNCSVRIWEVLSSPCWSRSRVSLERWLRSRRIVEAMPRGVPESSAMFIPYECNASE